ncbi:MAG: c-type cytochrome [Gemmobacter sp.]
MRRTAILATVLASAVALAAAWSYRHFTAPDPAGFLPWRDPTVTAAGAALYADHCAACHGAALEGAPDWRIPAKNGRMPAPPHDATGHTWHHPDAQLFLMTKYGVAAMVGPGYESDMPAYDGILNDAEIIAVLAWIKSTWPPEIQARHDAINRRVTP